MLLQKLQAPGNREILVILKLKFKSIATKNLGYRPSTYNVFLRLTNRDSTSDRFTYVHLVIRRGKLKPYIYIVT